MNNEVHVKTGDIVVTLNGKEHDKQGKALTASPKEGRMIVKGRNMVTKHVKPRKMGTPGRLVKAEDALYVYKVQIVCPRRGKPTRVAHKLYKDGAKDCACVKCGKLL